MMWKQVIGFAVVAMATAIAQTSSGSISGQVRDSSGGAVAGAQVRISGTETGGLVRELTTNQDGMFTAPLLRPLVSTVEVSAAGFKTLSRTGVVLRVDDALELKLTLEIGSASESVSVTANAEMLEERSNTVGQVIDDKTMQELPLNGRNYLQLGNLSAGAVPNTRSRDRSFSAYGNRGLQNAFLLDGARNQNYMRGLDNRARDAMRPSLEAISEFKVQTSNYSAEYGASAGAVVTVVTKSGSNEFHGSALEYLRNNKMDARDFFLPASSKQPLYIQHQFGGSLGGPIVKNRAWWHGAFQRTHISEGETNTATVPLAAERNGQFSLPIYDPASTRQSGTAFVRDLFPGNLIPVSRMDPIGRAIAARYPDPNLSGTARNWVNAPLQATRMNNGTFRGDVRLTDKDTLFARFSFDAGTFSRLPVLPVGAQTGVDREVPARSLGLGYTRIVSNSIVNELRFAYNYVGLVQDATMPKDEILKGTLAAGVESSIPTFGANGYATIGDQPPNFGNVPVTKRSKVWNISDNISIVRGAHTIRAGFDFQYLDVPTFAALQGRGSFGFSGVFTQNPSSRPGSGSSIADLLLGFPNSITIGTPSDANERARNSYYYVQDDWTVNQRLTLNFGVRYELTAPFYDANNRLANLVLDPGSSYGQYVIAGVTSGLPRALQTLDKNNIAPRFGFAWRAPGQWMVRGGFGIFFAQDEGFGVSQRMTNNPPFVGFGGYNIISDQLRISSTIPLSSSLPTRPAPVEPGQYTLPRSNTAQIRSWPGRNTIPYVEQWNLTLQRNLGKNLVWEVNYVGNHGVKLYGAYEGNQPLPGPGAVNSRRPLGSVVTSGSVLSIAPWVTSSYHGLSTRLERRFARGVSFLGVYTFGRALDMQSNIDLCDGCTNSAGSGNVINSYNRRLNYGLSDQHTAHRFVLSGLLELPFGKGKPWASSGPAAAIAGGWALSGITTLSTGLPLTLNLNFDNANTGSLNWPNRIASGTISNPTVDRWFDTSAFVFPSAFTHGNAGRNIIMGPGTVSTDLGLQRNFHLPFREGMRLEFRAEAFNLFNTPQFGAPNVALGNPAFGTIGGTARPNRQMQIGARFVF